MPSVDAAAPERDLFISYQTDDHLWAEWVAWQLEVAGISVFLDQWDNPSGGAGTVEFMDRALTSTRAMVAIWSAGYARKGTHSSREWNAARARNNPYPTIPVLIDAATGPPEGLGADSLYTDLRGLGEPQARAVLLARLVAYRGPGGVERQQPRAYFPAPQLRQARTLLHLADVHQLRADGISIEALTAGLNHLALDVGEPFVDLLAVSGGLLDSGRKKDVAPAVDQLRRLGQQLAVPRREMIVAPGPGDVGITLARLEEETAEDEGREPDPRLLDKWKPFDALAFALAGDKTGPLFEATSDQPWQAHGVHQLQITAMALNSVRHMDHQDHGRLGLGDDQLAAAIRHLSEVNTRAMVRVAVMAHSPALLPEREALLGLLQHEVDLMLTGAATPGHAPAAGRVVDRQVVAGLRADGGSPLANLLVVTEDEISIHPLYYDQGTGHFEPAVEPPPRTVRRHHRNDQQPEAGGRGRPRPEPLSPDGSGDELDALGHIDGMVDGGRSAHRSMRHPLDELVTEVRQATEFLHPHATVEWRDAGHLVVVRAVGANRAQYPIKAIDGPATREAIDEFDVVVRRFRRWYGSTVIGTLVHTGPAADKQLNDHAFANNVDLMPLSRYLGIVDFRPYLDRLRRQLGRDDAYAPALYLPHRYETLAGSLDGTAAHESLLDRLRGPGGGIYVVLGQAGIGKTFLLRQLARALSEPEADGSDPVVTPLLVSLRQLLRATPSLDGILAAHLAENDCGGQDPNAVDHLIRSGRIALLFDGYDEFANKVTFSAAERQLRVLLESVTGETKIVVTSRTSHFAHRDNVSKAIQLTPRGTMVRDKPAAHLLELEPFDPDQVLAFLRRWYGAEAPAVERLQRMKDIPDLTKLAATPRFLSAIAALPDQDLDAAEGPDGHASAFQLYTRLVKGWLTGEVRRRRDHSTASDGTEQLDDNESDQLEDLLNLMEELAVSLWRRGASALSAAELEQEIAEHLGELAAAESTRERAQQIGSGSLLVAEDGRFGFVHPSVGEWLIARRLTSLIHAARRRNQVHLLAEQRFTELVPTFLLGALGRTGLCQWLNQMEHEPQVEASAMARENLATLHTSTGGRHHKPGISYADRDLTAQRFSGNLQGADFSRATLNQAVFAGVDLRWADFTDASLRQSRFEPTRPPTDGDDRASPTPLQLDSATFAGADLTAAVLVLDRPPPGIGASLATAATLDRTAIITTDVTDLPPGTWFDPAAAAPRWSALSTFSSADYHPNGEFLAIGGGDGTVRVWDPATGSTVTVLEGHTSRVWGVGWSPDGTRLASASADETVRVWDPATGSTVTVLEGHTGGVWGVGWSPDGTRLASASADGTVRVWDPATGSTVSVLCLDEPVLAIVWADRGMSIGYSNRVSVFEFRDDVR
jgi:hypothetical protein